MSKAHSISVLLRSALKRKQVDHPAYSLRALARDLKVSAAFLSTVMNGKRLPPKDRIEKFCYFLELDILEREALIKAVLLDQFGVKAAAPRRTKKSSRKLKARASSEASTKTLLSSWQNLAILEGLTLSPPFNEPKSLRERLGLSSADFSRALAALAKAGLIREVNGVLQKKDELLHVSSGRSRKEIREFHAQMIAKARDEMMNKISQDDFERRLINGVTLTVNPARLEHAKVKIARFLDELAQDLGEGSSEDVYQCNFQLFPLTKKHN